MPTLQVHAQMKQWAAQQPTVMAATGPKTLSYGGANNGVGVLSGQAKVYLVFYGSQWGSQSTDANGNATFSGDASGAAPVAQQMFKGIGTGNELWSAELTQWCDGPNVASGAISCPSNGNFIPYQSGGVLSGVWYDNSSASPASATGHQLGQEAVNAAAHFGNTTAASNRYAYYVIMSPTGTNPDAYQGAYCAWHDWTGDTSLTGGAVSSPYGDIAFSNQPYNIDSGAGCGVGFVNSPGTLDGYTMTLGHEWHEMMSDQFPAGGWTNHVSGSSSNGQENSDECAWIAAGTAGGAANIVMGNGTYTEQASWSNDTNSCAISHAILTHGSGGTPTANFSFTTSGLTANFTDSSTDSGGTIGTHSWTFGDGGTSTATSPSHTYATAGTYSVAEKVTDSVSGSSNTKTQSVTVASAGGTPTANFGFVTNGLVATFTDSSTDSGGTISAHAWTFGDGATSTATSPSHTYAAGGTYSVTETVTDGVSGKTSAKTSSVTVVTTGGNVLSNGVPVTGLAATTGNKLNYTMVVPAGATNLKFAISGGTGDADLYVKFGSAPTLTTYDCRPYITGNNESCPIATAQGGTYYVMLNSYASFTGVSLVGSYTAAGGGGTPTANFTSSVSGLTATFTDTSTDSGGTISAHSWTFGDGGTSTAASPSHVYAAAGTYSVTETVTDGVSGKTSSKTASVTVSGGGTSSQLFGNTGFETGTAAPWTMSTGVLDNSTGEPAHAGSWKAWMDGYGSAHTDTVSQGAAIPSGKSSATLAFYLHIDTAETGSTAYDTLSVQVLNSSGTVLGTLATYSNVNAAAGYALHSLNMNAYIGQNVTVRFTGTEDGSNQTSFVLDDVTLTVQ
ncbi:MAG: PKD domain-containing protein [Dokdonella sp.]